MPVQLLPATAAAFNPRGLVMVVLGSKTEPWLTQTLKRVNRVKRPLNNVQQHTKCLTDILSSKNAIWTLASLMLAKKPYSELGHDDNSRAMHSFDMVHVDAYIVHVDMVHCNEVVFKLTPDTIDALVKYHQDVYCVDAKADSPHDWPDKEPQCKKLHNDYVQAINSFVFHAPAKALEGMEDEGAGELLCGLSQDAKTAVLALLKPLLPPPPPPSRPVMDVRPSPLLPNSSSPMTSMWPQSLSPVSSLSTLSPSISAVDAWHVLPSNNSPVASPESSSSPVSSPPQMWPSMNLADHSSPQSCYSQLSDQYPSHHHSPPPHHQAYPAYTTEFMWSSPPIPSTIPAMPLPSMLAGHCGMSMAPFATWDHHAFPEYAA